MKAPSPNGFHQIEDKVRAFTRDERFKVGQIRCEGGKGYFVIESRQCRLDRLRLLERVQIVRRRVRRHIGMQNENLHDSECSSLNIGVYAAALRAANSGCRFRKDSRIRPIRS